MARINRCFKLTAIDIILIVVVLMVGIGIAISNYQFQSNKDVTAQVGTLVKRVDILSKANYELNKYTKAAIEKHQITAIARNTEVLNQLSNASEKNLKATRLADLNNQRILNEQNNKTVAYFSAELLDMNEDLNNLVKAHNLTAFDRIINNGTHIFLKNREGSAISAPIPFQDFSVKDLKDIFPGPAQSLANLTSEDLSTNASQN